tara:strand:+ start:95 stop:322 length:228 start_codon:yes stop_codon:yes gene_type:complete
LGISVADTNHPRNLRYLKPEDNIDKFSFIYGEEKDHLAVMCEEVWNIPYPDHTLIDEHNHDAEIKSNALKGKDKE